MLAKKYRLPIQTVLGKSGATSKNSLFTVKVFPNTLPHCRFGVIISKKVAALATERNCLRRTIFSACEGFLKNKGSKDILIIAAPFAAKAEAEDLKMQIHKILAHII